MIKVFFLMCVMTCTVFATCKNEHSSIVSAVDNSLIEHLSIQEENFDEPRTVQDLYRSLSAVVNTADKDERGQKLIEIFDALIGMYDALKADIYYADNIAQFLLCKETLEGEIWNMFSPEWKILVQQSEAYFKSELESLNGVMSGENAQTFNYQEKMNEIMVSYFAADARKCEVVENKMNEIFSALEVNGVELTVEGADRRKLIHKHFILDLEASYLTEYLLLLNLNIAKEKWTTRAVAEHVVEFEGVHAKIKKTKDLLAKIAAKEAEESKEI